MHGQRILMVQGDNISCQVRLLKGNETLYQKAVYGNKNDLPALVNKLIEEVVKYAK